jgi:hypothetical protein
VTISRRTKVLLSMGAVAPISIIVTRLEIAGFVAKAKREGAFSVWVDPGPVPKLLLLLGLASFVAGVVSFIFDLRRVR